MQFVHLGKALWGDFLAPALCWGQRFWQDFVPFFSALMNIPLMFIILAPNALGL